MKNFFLMILFCSSLISAQDSESLLTLNDFNISLQNQTLLVKDKNDSILYEKIFNSPSYFTFDLDEDGNDEYIIIDSVSEKNIYAYTFYLFNTIDSFNLIDSIYSGIVEPYYLTSQELGAAIIISGNPSFNIFYTKNAEYFLPINCWRYEGSELFLINDEIYELFLEENDRLIEYLNFNFSSDCNYSLENKPAIASVYANYLNAGEESVASQFLKKYYLCNDIEEFKTQIRELIIGKTNEDGLE